MIYMEDCKRLIEVEGLLRSFQSLAMTVLPCHCEESRRRRTTKQSLQGERIASPSARNDR